MKKMIYFILILILVFALGACDNKAAEGQEGSDSEAASAAGAGDSGEAGSNTESGSNAESGSNTEAGGKGSDTSENSENKDGQNRSEGQSSSGDSYSKPKHPTYKNDPNQEVIYIREKMFVAQTNDIYLNAQDYLGKKIKYEGMFKAYTDPRSNITYYSVIRYGPGCCGTDMNCGFEVIWLDGEAEYPEDDAWVEVEGILGFVEGENGYKFLRLDMTSLKVLEKRGLETVLQ